MITILALAKTYVAVKTLAYVADFVGTEIHKGLRKLVPLKNEEVIAAQKNEKTEP